MSTWNHRVVKVTYNKGEAGEEVAYEIREAYYNKDGSIWAVNDSATGVYSDEGIEGLMVSLTRMTNACKQEIIDLDTFVFAQADFEREDTSGIDWSKIHSPDFTTIFAKELAELEEQDKEIEAQLKKPI
jgi:hypothetical protein